MDSELKKALALLGIKEEETIKLFFNYLYAAGYLDEQLIRTAVQYLHTERAFEGFELHSSEAIAETLINTSKQDEILFFDTFANGLASTDIIDLIVFLQQTAFDRKFGEERAQLEAKDWMQNEDYQNNFMALLEHLGLIREQPPKRANYYVVGIMGASYPGLLSA